jgi:hypothetical protein
MLEYLSIGLRSLLNNDRWIEMMGKNCMGNEFIFVELRNQN